MAEVNGLDSFRIKAIAHRGSETQVIFAERLNDNQEVVLRAPVTGHFSQNITDRFQHEKRMISQLVAHTGKSVLSRDSGSHELLVFPRNGGQLLSQMIAHGGLSTQEILDIAVSASEAIEEVHAAGILHKDIRPSNLLVEPSFHKTLIINFGLASPLSRELQAATHCPHEGTVAYMSPEQTGRINRHVDSRSDLYNLGVTLYELVTGRLPFPAKDTLETISAHIAAVPQRPDVLNKDLPHPLADLIMKLLMKDAAKRYQSAAGLTYDLKLIRDRLARPTELEGLELGRADKRTTLLVPEGLYGRETELATLTRVLERAGRGGHEVVFLAGAAGIGKTSLVKELISSMLVQNTRCVQGKFEQLQMDVPYFALGQSMRQIVRQMSTSDPKTFEEWKSVLQSLLKEDLAVLAELIPEMRQLFGTLPDQAQISPGDRLERFVSSIIRFFQANTRPDSPLVLFIDDLQWADVPSILVLQRLALDVNLKYMMLIFSYRDTEVDSSHHFSELMRIIKGRGEPEELRLGLLSQEATTRIVEDTLQERSNQTSQLASLVQEKTQGNPFFVLHFLNTLYHRQLLKFDNTTMRWTYDVTNVRQQEFTDNVVAMVIDSLRDLPSDTLTMLETAALLGARFDLQRLSAISGHPHSTLVGELLPAFERKFIDSSEESLHLFQTRDEIGNLTFWFSHDRVQQAVCECIPEEERTNRHLQIARHLYRSCRGEQLDEILFELADHYDQALSLVLDPSERATVLDLNLKAGQRAKESVALDSAINYLQTAEGLCRRLGDAASRQQKFRVYLELADVYFRTGNLDKVLEYSNNATDLVKEDDEAVALAEVRVQAFASRQLWEQAIAECVHLIQRLEIWPTDRWLSWRKQWNAWRVRRGKIRWVETPDKMTEEKLKLFRRVAGMISPVVSGLTYLNPRLLESIAIEAICLVDRFGVNELSVLGASMYSISSNIKSDFTNSKRYTALYRRYEHHLSHPYAILLTRHVWNVFHNLVACTLDEIQDNWDSIQAHAASVRFLEFITLIPGVRVLYRLIQGFSLQEASDVFERYHTITQQQKQGTGNTWVSLGRQVCDNLQRKVEKPWILNGEHFNEDKAFAVAQRESSQVQLLRLKFIRALIAYNVGAHQEAMAMMKPLVHIHHRDPSLVGLSFPGYFQLAVLSNWKQISWYKRGLLAVPMWLCYRRLKNIAHHGPKIFAAQLYAVRALMFSKLGLTGATLRAFCRAIQEADAAGLKFLLIKLHILQAEYLAAIGDSHLSQQTLRNASALAQQLGIEQLVPEVSASETATYLTNHPIAHSDNAGVVRESKLKGLDLDTIVSASRVIGGSLELEELLTRLMELAVNTAGAQHGILLLNKDGEWVPRAFKRMGEDTIFMSSDRPTERAEAVPPPAYSLEAVRTVERTGQLLMLPDALHSQLASDSEHIRKHEVLSLLCLPLIDKGKINAILYLENNLAVDVFNSERIGVLDVLSNNMALAIDQAISHARTKELQRSFSRFVPMEFLEVLGAASVLELKPGDYVTRSTSVLFSDVRDYTTLTEERKEGMYRLLNEYLAYASPAISKNHGVVLRFIGDCILAIFYKGAHQENAIRAAIAVVEALNLFNVMHPEQLIDIGVGVDTGDCQYGIMGEPNHVELALGGDAVNSASRIEGINKLYGTKILVSGRLLEGLADGITFTTRLIDTVYPKGKENATQLYEVLDCWSEKEQAKIHSNENSRLSAMNLYYSGRFVEAAAAFESYDKMVGDSVLAATMIKRCRALAQSKPSDWNGVYRLDIK